MSSLVIGSNVVVKIYDNGVWKLYGCARNCSLQVSTDIIETSTSGSGNFATFIPSKNSFGGSIDGLVSLGTNSVLTLADLRQRQISGIKLNISFTRTAQSGAVYTDTGNFLITDSSDTGNYDNAATYSISIRGTGLLTQTFTPPSGGGIVKRYDYTASGGEDNFTAPVLIGGDILLVDKDGMGRAGIITVGIPADKEALFTSASGNMKFAQPFETGEKAYVLYQ